MVLFDVSKSKARSGATLAIGDFGDEISLGGTSIATLEDLPSPQDAQTLRHQKETIACLVRTYLLLFHG